MQGLREYKKIVFCLADVVESPEILSSSCLLDCFTAELSHLVVDQVFDVLPWMHLSRLHHCLALRALPLPRSFGSPQSRVHLPRRDDRSMDFRDYKSP